MNLDISFYPSDQTCADQIYFRKKLINHYLDINKWKNLSANIDKFDPDVIILIARKIPRIYQTLKLVYPDFLKAPLIISNFAIDYLPKNYLNGKKIAIVDDSLNIGTTLKNTEKNIKRLFSNTQTQFFAVHQSNNKHIINAILADNTPLSIDKYQDISNCSASSLICIPRPVEIEFPIFTVDINKKFSYKDFLDSLKESNLPLQGNSLDSLHCVAIGINKFSVDIFPGHNINNKWRFYSDNALHKLVFVPMADYDPSDNRILEDELFQSSFNDEILQKNLSFDSLNRLKSYINSLTWGKKSWTFIQEVASLADSTIDKNEINLLFGPIFAEKIVNFYNNIPPNYDCLFEFEDKKQTLYFYDAYKKLNSVDEKSRIKIEDDNLSFNVFQNFLLSLVN